MINHNWTHDRHFCFKDSEKWYYYKMTGEFDQCWFSDTKISDWATSTVGVWEELSILKVNKEHFPSKLLDIIFEIEGGIL